MKLHKWIQAPVHRMLLALVGLLLSLTALANAARTAVFGEGGSAPLAILSAALAVMAWSLYFFERRGTRSRERSKLSATLPVMLLTVVFAVYYPFLPGLSWALLAFLPVVASLFASARAYRYYSLLFLALIAAYTCLRWQGAGTASDPDALSAAGRILLAAGGVALGGIVLVARHQLKKQLEERALRQQKRQIINMLQCFIPVGERKTQTSRLEISKMSALMKALRSECGDEGANDWEIDLLSLLHFVSRVKLPDYMFEKEGKLSAFELEVVKEHCFMAKELCEGVPGFEEVENAFLYHHEKVDGTGYPHRLKADQIPNLSQMLGLVEVFLAMTTARSYRPEMTEPEAYEEIRKLAGTSFRPDLVEAFGRALSREGLHMA